MKPLGIKKQNTKPGEGYTQRQPFTNNTGYHVGQVKVVNGKPVIITAIVRITDKQFSIYGMDATLPMKVDYFTDCQERRESGQINVYLPGKVLFRVTVK